MRACVYVAFFDYKYVSKIVRARTSTPGADSYLRASHTMDVRTLPTSLSPSTVLRPNSAASWDVAFAGSDSPASPAPASLAVCILVLSPPLVFMQQESGWWRVFFEAVGPRRRSKRKAYAECAARVMTRIAPPMYLLTHTAGTCCMGGGLVHATYEQMRRVAGRNMVIQAGLRRVGGNWCGRCDMPL